MPAKKIEKNAEENKKPKLRTLTCGNQSPGPKYKLPPVLGYKEHCHSKYRNPAYTLGKVQKIRTSCIGPGPKYLPKLSTIPGYSIPRAVHRDAKDCSPGPKYKLPDFVGSPAFTIVGKPKERCMPALSGPYDPPKYPRGPAFAFGLKGKDRPCEYNPPIRHPGDAYLPSSPAFHIIGRLKTKDTCVGPGPAKYFPKLKDKGPAYSMGLRHHECITVPRTDCDELC